MITEPSVENPQSYTPYVWLLYYTTSEPNDDMDQDQREIKISQNRIEETKQFVSDWITEERIPGATFSVFDPDGVTSGGFGARNLQRNEPATPDTLLGIGSCTKSFTGVALLQLAEDDQLMMEDPVSDYVAVYEEAPGDPITIRALLTHSSGFPSDGMATALISRMMGLDPMETPLSGTDDIHRHMQGALAERATHLENPFFYYNSGFTVLGEVIEAVSGLPYAEYIDQHIFQPLGMERSTFSREAFDSDTNTMTPYYKKDGSSIKGHFPFDNAIHAPGGILSTVRELARYGQMHLNGGRLNSEQILSEASVEKGRTPVSQREQLIDGTSQKYAYGWMVREFINDTLIGHGGGIGVYNAFIGYLKDAELGVALQCTTTPDIHPMYEGAGVLALLRGEDPQVAVPQLALSNRLPEFTGEYKSYRGIMEFFVDRIGGGLRLTAENDRIGTMELALLPEDIGGDVWEFRTVEASGASIPVQFERINEGIDMYYQRWRLHKED